MAFKATSDNVILLMEHKEKTTEAGLVIPQGAVPLPDIAEVVSVGPDVEGINEGDNVVFKHGLAYAVEIAGVKYIQVPVAGIVAVLDKKN
jgi:co-chaperonin GroES (HSP10)